MQGCKPLDQAPSRSTTEAQLNMSRLSPRDLELQARTVETQIKKLDHRHRLTPNELDEAARLKRVRLSLKDQLATKR